MLGPLSIEFWLQMYIVHICKHQIYVAVDCVCSLHSALCIPIIVNSFSTIVLEFRFWQITFGKNLKIINAVEY